MSNSTVKLLVIIGIVVTAIAVVAGALATFVYFDKKKNKKELEHYLDCAIQ